ncbi:MAG: YwqG family protein [Chitinophagaceae bacterium]
MQNIVMGFFDFIFGKKEETKKTNVNLEWLQIVEILPGLKLPNAFSPYKQEIEATSRSFISIEATPVKELTLQESKFGHYPMMPLHVEYPLDAQNEYMYPLAQINFNDLPALPNYPSTGYLQFYISAFDESYGINFENPKEQINFRVLYFENEEVEEHKTDFSFLEKTMNADYLPISSPHSLNFFSKEEYIGIGDAQYETNENSIQKIINSKLPDIENELLDSVYDNCQSNGHKIGGYAYFSQEDPRLYDENFKDYVLLFQMDTDEEIMWGDSGIANFFIHKDDLVHKDFSNVLFNWDCY